MFGGGSGQSTASNAGSTAMLGEVEHFQESIAKAKSRGLDVLLFFRVNVNLVERTGLVTNNTTIEMIDVANQRIVFTLPRINNLKIQRIRLTAKENGKDDPLEVEIDKLFEFADVNYRMQPMPEQTPEEVLESRIRPLVSSKPENPLAALAEIKFLYSQELVKKEHLPVAFEQILGKEIADKWMAGDTKGRSEILAQWLPRANARGGVVEDKPFR
jgi:hypothetical protein